MRSELYVQCLTGCAPRPAEGPVLSLSKAYSHTLSQSACENHHM